MENLFNNHTDSKSNSTDVFFSAPVNTQHNILIVWKWYIGVPGMFFGVHLLIYYDIVCLYCFCYFAHCAAAWIPVCTGPAMYRYSWHQLTLKTQSTNPSVEEYQKCMYHMSMFILIQFQCTSCL